MIKMSSSELHELFWYEPQTGVLINKPRTEKHIPDLRIRNGTNTKIANKPAGYVCDHGYVRLRVGRKHVRAHQIIWKMVHGADPAAGRDIDHIDGDRTNNRIDNLRVIDRYSNSQNRHNVRSDSKTGVLGVSKIGNVYRAAVCINGKKRHFGCFKTTEEAHAAYVQAKRVFHPVSSL